jgi:hypothetical protein
MSDPTLIADLVRAGVDAELVGRVANALLDAAAPTGKSGGIPVDIAAENRRAYDRERKASKRNSTGLSTGLPPEFPNALPSSSSHDPGKVNQKEVKKEEASRRKTGHALPDDWQPKDHHYRFADECRRPHADVDAKAEEVRLWAKANAHRAVARKTDWDAMFTGCLRRDWGKNGASNGTRPHHGNHRQSGAADFFAGLAEVAADIDRDGAVAGPAGGDIPLGRHNIDADPAGRG